MTRHNRNPILKTQRVLVYGLMLVALALPQSLAPMRVAHAVDGALMTGKTLTLLCSSTKEDDLFSCQSYIAGVIDYHRLIKGLGTAPSVDFCLPAGLKMDQIRQIVTRYMTGRSEHQDFIAAPAVVMSLYNAYPCKKAKR